MENSRKLCPIVFLGENSALIDRHSNFRWPSYGGVSIKKGGQLYGKKIAIIQGDNCPVEKKLTSLKVHQKSTNKRAKDGESRIFLTS